MTWLGKILTFLVLIAAVAWMYFTVLAYQQRTNWQKAATNFEQALKDSENARRIELARYQADVDSLKRLLINDQTKSTGLQKQVETLTEANKKNNTDFLTLQKAFEEGDAKNVILAANVETTLKELDTIRARNTDLENQMTGLVLEAEKAKREMVRAQNQARLSDSIAKDYGKKIEELNDRISEMRAQGGSNRLQLDKPPPPVLSNLRGQVDRVEGDIVQLSIGLDSGLSKGTVLELYRLGDGGKYLGTIKVADLYPKTSTAYFYPADPKRSAAQLRPDELPKVGDLVRPSESLGGGIIQR